jgi:hypothetical protein|tara:strand:+ start:456 stop:665 length:210 start_codon:yes stop_codon:yes gene_type:complete
MTTDNSDERIRNLEIQQASHEVQCEERWRTNFSRLVDLERQLDRIENIIRAGGATTIIFLAGIVFTLLM